MFQIRNFAILMNNSLAILKFFSKSNDFHTDFSIVLCDTIFGKWLISSKIRFSDACFLSYFCDTTFIYFIHSLCALLALFERLSDI
ncbi:hypothetical protein AM586_17655 [Massilia sp. WG5]|nr:hypothetical protein AM586_17655 [Massilia sp. WG5]